MKWQSMKVNVQFSLINTLRYLTFSSVRAVFGRPLPGFRSVADPRLSTHLQIAFTEQSFQPFSWNFVTIVQYPKPTFRNVSIRALSSYILPITKFIGLTAIMTWNIEEFITMLSSFLACNSRLHSAKCYVTGKHKNNVVTTKVVLVAQLL